MVLERDEFENGNTKLFLYEGGGLYAQVGIVGMWLTRDEAASLHELLAAYLDGDAND